MAVRNLQRGDISRGVRYANAVEALTVARLGVQPALPTRTEAERFIQIC